MMQPNGGIRGSILLALVLAAGMGARPTAMPETDRDTTVRGDYPPPLELPAPTPEQTAGELASQALQILGGASFENSAQASPEEFRRADALALRARLAEDGGFLSGPGDPQLVEEAVQAASAHAPPKVELEAIPWVAQDGERLCGIAAAYMMLAQRGFHPSLDDLQAWAGRRINETGVHIRFFSKILPDRLGVRVLAGTGSPELLRCALAAGFPVVVLQWVTVDRSTPHLRVVVGYDDSTGVFLIRDPAPELGPSFRLPYDVFEQLWSLPWRRDGASHWLAFIYATGSSDSRPDDAAHP